MHKYFVTIMYRIKWTEKKIVSTSKITREKDVFLQSATLIHKRYPLIISVSVARRRQHITFLRILVFRTEVGDNGEAPCIRKGFRWKLVVADNNKIAEMWH